MVAVGVCMGSTRGLSSTGDVVEMSVVRGVGGVCDIYVYGSGLGGAGCAFSGRPLATGEMLVGDWK